MIKTLDDFVKKLKKLDNYFILREEAEYLIIGTKIIIKEHKEFLGNVFQPRTQNIDKEVPVFFLITFNKEKINIIKEFTKRNYPILTYTNFNIKNLKLSLDEFVINHFK